jgi:membrane peptidoglycan carboxypeptidase
VRTVRAPGAEGEAGETPLAPSLDERVVPETAAYLVLDALRGAAETGTAKALADVLGGVPVAAKTGTSQRGRDGWVAVVTGSAVVVVWVGRDDGAPAGLSGPGAAVPVARRLLAERRDELLSPLREPPSSVAVVHVDPERGCDARRPRAGTVREAYPEPARPPSCRSRWWRRLVGS